MIRLLSLAVTVFCVASSAFSAVVWETDFLAARKKAQEQSRGMLIFFSESDTHAVNGRLDHVLLSDERFLKEVENDYVFLELNYSPSNGLDEARTMKNSQLAQVYGASSLPSCVVFANATGKPFYLIYAEQPVEEALEEVKTANELRQAFDERLKSLRTAAGDRRYELIGEIIRPLPDAIVDGFYKQLVQEALEKDSNDRSGLLLRDTVKRQEAGLGKFMESMVDRINQYPDQAIKEIEDYANLPHIYSESKQLLWAQTAYIMLDNGRVDEAEERLQQAIDIMPTSEHVKSFRKMKETVRKYRADLIEDAKKRGKLKEAGIGPV